MSLSRGRSIRARLLIGILLTLVLILGSAAWWSYAVTQHESEELFSARLATSARVLDALVARQVERATLARPLVIALPRELEQASGDVGSPLGHPYETKIAFQVWHEDGRLLVRSTSAPARPFGPNVPGFAMRMVEGELCHVFVLQSGNTWIQVAEKDEVRGELLHDLGVAVMTPLVVGAVLLLVLVNLLVIYGLAPLEQLATDIAHRKPDALVAIEMRAVPREVAPVVRALNGLLHRVKLALERERRFTDAAAHELRTPLAALKIHADNMARAQTEAERARSLAQLERGLDRTTKLATQMLAYSRTQDALEREQQVALDLADLVREAIATVEPVRLQKSQRIELDAPVAAMEVQVHGEPTKLERLVVNLLDNAARYAPDHSVVKVGVRRDRSWVVLSVSNAGPAIPEQLRERVFEPYYRLPGSGSEGSGLGLAIVKEIALQHGASVTLDSISASEGTTVTVRFPAPAQGGAST
ncbi:MAG: sensor histidine kinase N-terminal domain-containing protein [Burkholderiales bacterium]|nr:sensor histidine kinase N-terminal domain-containing protein [Burkholderiales bacterium]